MASEATVICMKWHKRYPSVYVNRLFAAVRRNLARPHRFICFTDDPEGLDPRIDAQPLPPCEMPDAICWTPWRKLTIWQHPLCDIQGDILFLDLDLVVTGPLDPFFDFEPGRFCVIENWTQKGEGIGNTSVFRFPANRHGHVYSDFAAAPERHLRAHRIEQQYISAQFPDRLWWPEGWCQSFKHNIVPRFPMNWVRDPALPDEAKIVVFTGRPDIDEAARGEWPAPWYKKFYKHARPARWIDTHWRDEDIA